MRKRCAFTLIELLVVIAIIAVLLSILMPSLKRVKLAAKKAVSMSNMKQIGLAMTMYTDENSGYFPDTTHSVSADKAWVYTLSPYLSDVDEVRIDPADPKRTERLEKKLTSYVMNEYIGDAETDPFGNRVGQAYNNLRKLAIPSKTITVFVGADDLDLAAGSDHIHSKEWFDGVHDPVTEIPKDIQIDRYGSTTLFLYADPHVESIKAEEILDMAEKNYNFAEPPH